MPAVFGRRSYAVAVAIIVLLAGKALAQDQAVVEKLVQMNKQALDHYDTLEWDAAKKTLLEALRIAGKARLGDHPMVARTYLNLGAVYILGFKNRNKAIQCFSRALKIDPALQLKRGVTTQDLNEAFAEAQRARTAPRIDPPAALTAADDSEERDLPVRVHALDCPNEDEAIIDRPVTLRCAVAPNLPVARVYLMYREPREERYTEQQMYKSPKGWYVGKIPKRAVVGKSLMYYFEGRNASGQAIVRNGEVESPNIILLMDAEAYDEMKRGSRRFR